ncbi:hypothetical protein HZF05_04960 [Sphingomonas sp. CGMCC 1.13654]|uniref:Uncharacterized protein n=1 Tax=Sphingomonas chungangi TaxID=2683589 RepID=A0A838L4F5_9SPHN|nr:hypothetical protein [Sphingomonas chungangi]MBA2933442.1 hypothetical protein [Sphingomonas chungangi]MVW54775.1 hypothetical protein [Sphingomonas chungangi]
MTEAEPRSNGRIRTVSAPVEHQGVRDALRVSFDCSKDMPAEFAKLLNRIP